MSCVVCASDGVHLRPAVDVFVVPPYSVHKAIKLVPKTKFI